MNGSSFSTENKRIVMDVAASGSLVGAMGGLAMALILCLQSFFVGNGFWFPMQLQSGMFYGDNAILGGLGPTAVGLLVHFVSASVLGIVFALFLRPRTPGTDAVAFGLIYGIILWALQSYIWLPAFNPTMGDRVALIPGWWFLSHLAYGAMMGLIPQIRRTMARRLGEPRTPRIAA